MENNLKKASRDATSLVGITEPYRDFLLNYAGRKYNIHRDNFFPLGYNKVLNKLSTEEKLKAKNFWHNHFNNNPNSVDKKIIYFAGNFSLTFYNSVKKIVSSIKKLEKICPDYIFIFCGSGKFKNQIEALFVNVSNVILPGLVNKKNLFYLRDISYLAIQPIENRFDYKASLSNKFFENISSGLPIITSLEGVTKEIIEKNKIGYIYQDELSFLNLMKKMYKNINLRNEISSRAIQLFNKKFTSKIVYNNYADHCEKIVKNFNLKN